MVILGSYEGVWNRMTNYFASDGEYLFGFCLNYLLYSSPERQVVVQFPHALKTFMFRMYVFLFTIRQ